MAVVPINTTQNVRIDYEVAGLPVRIGAFLIDLFLVVVGYSLLVFLVVQFDLSFADAAIFGFGPIFFFVLYFFFCEMFSRGQTAGKRLLNLRVIRMDGHDPTPADFLARAVFLLVDVLLTVGGLAVVLIATTEHARRLGDLVAGTVVIHTRRFGSVGLADILTIRNREQHSARYPAVQRLTDEDMLVVKETLLRYRRYGNPAHRRALALLSERMGDLLDLPDGERPNDPSAQTDFLQRLLLDYIVLTR